VSLFESVFGFLPFEREDIFQIASNVQNNPIRITLGCSSELKDILQKMLHLNPFERISMIELLEHPFFNITNEFDVDSIEPLLIPELGINQEIKHISANTLKSHDFHLMESCILSTLPMNIFSFGLRSIGFNN
jgi:serine/threonine protein kinase